MSIEELFGKLKWYVEHGDGKIEVRLGGWMPVSAVEVTCRLNGDTCLSLHSVDW
jgi:hypothetical protein